MSLATITPDQWIWISYALVFGILCFAAGCYLGYTECKREFEVFIQEWLPEHWARAEEEQSK